MDIKCIKDNENGKTYLCDGFKIVYKYKDKYGGDNATNKRERIILISGTAKFTIQDQIVSLSAPNSVEIPAKTYHRIDAITDIAFIKFEE